MTVSAQILLTIFITDSQLTPLFSYGGITGPYYPVVVIIKITTKRKIEKTFLYNPHFVVQKNVYVFTIYLCVSDYLGLIGMSILVHTHNY